MMINAVGLAKPYAPSKKDAADTRAFDFLPHGGQQDEEAEDCALNRPSEFDLENAVLKANTSSAVMQKLTVGAENATNELTGIDAVLAPIFKVINAPPPTHPASIHDLSREEIESLFVYVRQIASLLNTKGLSNGEIYSKMESLFTAYFGSDFLEPAAILRDVRPNDSTIFHMKLSCMFYAVLDSHGVGSDNLAGALREARGFAGMSNDEIIAAMRERFPSSMTYRDVFLMSHELLNMRAIDVCIVSIVRGTISHNVASAFSRQYPPGADWPNFQETIWGIFENMLDSPANFDNLLRDARTFREYGVIKPFDFTSVREFETALSRLEEEKADGLRRLMEQMLKEMEEEMLSDLMGVGQEAS